ncbi:putative zinc transporter [Forsythia ovata]|uniref:Zinc transporter n=1 Tax=Forsythia ovata TaxID=205694 RepID=A0ABD1U7I5_9LAMI
MKAREFFKALERENEVRSEYPRGSYLFHSLEDLKLRSKGQLEELNSGRGFLEQHGDMLDLEGAEAAKVILVVGIMTLHSFGEGSGVGISFAGSKGLSQGILVTLAISVHNIPEGPIVAVPSFISTDAFNKFLPFATGFAAGCMNWMVIAEVLPNGFEEASPSHVTSAATLSGAFMEALGAVFEHLSHNYKSIAWWNSLVAFALTIRLQHALPTGVASGIAFVLDA